MQEAQRASSLYGSQPTRDGRAQMKAKSAWPKRNWEPQAGWGVPLAWLTLCVVWSSTWLAIKIGLRDLPPISFVAIRFLIAIIVLITVSIGRTRLLPLRRNDYALLAITGVLMFAVNYTLLFWAELHVSSGLAAVLQATIPIFGILFAHWMLPDEPLRFQKLAGAIIALGGVALICGRLLGFNGPLAFWGGVAACTSHAGRVADDFRNCPVVGSWVRRRRKPSTLSLDRDGNLLSALSGDHWLGANVSASLLAPAATDRRTIAKHLPYHATRSSNARVANGRRNLSGLVAIWCSVRPCWGVADFPKNQSENAADSGRLISYVVASRLSLLVQQR